MKYLLACLLLSFSLSAQICYENEPFILETLMQANEEQWNTLSTGDLRIKVASLFIGTPYEGGTLEAQENEMLIVNLKEQDCTTFLEYVMAFTTCIEKGQLKVSDFYETLIQYRYRSGKIDGYLSRLHYFSEWIIDNQSKGLIKDITKDIGGLERNKVIDFMSDHIGNYECIRSKEDVVALQRIELALNKHEFFYIPQEELVNKEALIPHGAMVVITTSIKGLDVVHVGFAFREGNKVKLLHASSDFKKVLKAERYLSDYVLSNKNQDGVMIIN